MWVSSDSGPHLFFSNGWAIHVLRKKLGWPRFDEITGESTGENLAHLCGPLEVFWPTSVDHWRISGPHQEITGGFHQPTPGPILVLVLVCNASHITRNCMSMTQSNLHAT